MEIYRGKKWEKNNEMTHCHNGLLSLIQNIMKSSFQFISNLCNIRPRKKLIFHSSLRDLIEDLSKETFNNYWRVFRNNCSLIMYQNIIPWNLLKSYYGIQQQPLRNTLWKDVSSHCVKSLPIRSSSGPNTAKYGPEKLRIRTLLWKCNILAKTMNSKCEEFVFPYHCMLQTWIW